MRKSHTRLVLFTLVLTGTTVLFGLRPGSPAEAQAPATPTSGPAVSQAYITNTFEEAINVRLGPSTILYPIPCGSLPVGATAVALGTTPAHEWVQIEFADCPGGTGWVYAANVTLTGAVREVEPPPTPLPIATSTLDPTLVAAFQSEPTATRLPTFTPPPPLVRPTFAETDRVVGGLPTGAVILGTALLGGLVLAMSLLTRR